MFDFVRKHTRVLFFILLVPVMLSFAFVGGNMDRFGGGPAQRVVASVAGHDIKQAEYDRAHQQRLARVRSGAPQVDVRLIDTPEFRQSVLDELVRQQLMRQAAKAYHLSVTDERLQRVFVSDPQFAFVRNPDGTVNKALLQASGLSSADFAAQLQQSLAEQQVTLGVAASSLVTPALATTALNAYFQQREVQVQRFEPKDYVSKVSVSDADLEAFYKEPATALRFQVPEQVDVEYVVFDLNAVARDIVVADEELKAYYQQNLTRFGNPEERRASHILIAAGADAKPEDRAKARAKAESLLEALKKNPRSFAELAQKNSQDAGSAKAGGDLGFIPRGDLVKPFSDALYALKSGEISEVVETDQGFHIIQLTAQRGGDVRSFESVRSDILAEVRKAQAQKKFPDLSQEFSNMVFEQGDSLKAVADKWKLEIRTLKQLTRQGSAADPVGSHPKFLEAVFAPEAIRDQHNMPAVELDPAQMVGARVLKYSAARQPALSEVQAPVRAAYVAKASAALARQDGEAQLAAFKAAVPATLKQKAELVSRVQSGAMPRPFLEQVLSVPAQTLPAVVGSDQGEQGYALALITRVVGLDPVVAADAEAGRRQYAQVWDAAESQAYLDALKTRFKVEVKPLK